MRLKTQKNFFSISNHLLGNTSAGLLPNEPIASLVNEFSNDFHTKVTNIIDLLPYPIVPPPNTSSHSFTSLTPPSIPFIEQLLTSVNTSSTLDPLPHFLTLKFAHYLAPYYKDVIDQSLSFYTCFKSTETAITHIIDKLHNTAQSLTNTNILHITHMLMIYKYN